MGLTNYRARDRLFVKFALHVIALPLILVGLVVVHIMALHHVGSNNPDGIEIKENKDERGIPRDGIRFHPYYTVKDLMGAMVFLFFFAAVIFFLPEMGGYFLEHANFEPADPLKTPDIAPVWYFTPFYAILRAVPDKLLGVMAMGGAILVLFLLPWLDRSSVKSIRYRGRLCKTALSLFFLTVVMLGYLGSQPPTPLGTAASQIGSVLYFLFFLAMPIYTKLDKTKPVPERVGRSSAMASTRVLPKNLNPRNN